MGGEQGVGVGLILMLLTFSAMFLVLLIVSIVQQVDKRNRVKRYKYCKKVKIELTASDWDVVTRVLFNSGQFEKMEKITDQLCKNKKEWAVSNH